MHIKQPTAKSIKNYYSQLNYTTFIHQQIKLSFGILDNSYSLPKLDIIHSLIALISLQFPGVSWNSVSCARHPLKYFSNAIFTISISEQIQFVLQHRPVWQTEHRKYLVDFHVAPDNVDHDDIYSDVEDDYVIVNDFNDNDNPVNIEDD